MALLDVFRRSRGGRTAVANMNSSNDPANAPDGPAAERVNTQEAAMPATETIVGSPSNVTAPTTPPTPTPTAAAAAPAASAAATPTPSLSPTIVPVVAANEQPATLAELKADFGDDPAFMVECLDQKRSLLAAHRARNIQLSAKAANLAKLGTAGVGGATPVATGPAGVAGGTGASDETDYEAQVKKTAREKNISLAAATTEVNRTHPHLREAYVGRAHKKRTHAAA